MIDRRSFIVASVGTGVALATGAAELSGGGAIAASNPNVSLHGYGSSHVESVTAVTQVFGDGQKLIALVIEFDRAIRGSQLSASTFKVIDRTITKVYASHTGDISGHGRDGRFVVVELSPEDAAALLWVPLPHDGSGGGPGPGGPQVGDNTPGNKIVPASATVLQVSAVVTTDGHRYAADSTTALITNKVKNLIVDDFEQFSYTDPATSRTLTYNLFKPKHMRPGKRYPLVLFMHDAGVIAVPTLGPLVQGNGATSWASPEDQAKHPCFVLAPEYPEVVIADDYKPSTYFDATVNLLKAVASTYNVDPDRIYSTGQSMGAMMTLGINIKYPDLLAASYVVAGQWPADQAAPLARKKLWVTVSEGDTKAFPTENQIMSVVKGLGTKVAQAQWDGSSTGLEFAADVRALLAQHAPINYAHFTAGTLPAVKSGKTMEHPATWQVAYDIPSIRAWIMRQSL